MGGGGWSPEGAMWTRVRVLGAGTCRRVSDDRLVLGGRPCCSILDQRRLRALEAEARLWCVWASAHAQLLVAAVARSALGDRPCCSIVDQRRLRALEAEARLWCVWPSAHAELLLAAVAVSTAAAAAVSAAPAAAAAGAL